MRAADSIRDRTRGQAIWFGPHEKAKYFKPRRLTEGGQGSQCMGR
jgi:hypothetical protein